MTTWELRRSAGMVLLRVIGISPSVHCDHPIVGHVQLYADDRLITETWGWPRYDWIRVDGRWMHRDPSQQEQR